MIPTPQELARSLTDLASGYDAEVVGMTPDPALGKHIATMARRIVDRVRPADPRLAAFAPFTSTGPAGYVWLPPSLHPFLKRAELEYWSFERWLTELAALLTHLQPPTAEQLAALAAAGDEVDQLRTDGYRPIAVDEHAGLIVKRDPS